MRKGWEYKKLGDVAQIVSGATPKTNIEEYWGQGHYWVTPAELNDSTIYVNKTERQITDAALAKTNLQFLPKGTVLLSSRAPIGKVAICNTEMYCNQGFKNCICSEKLYNKYLFYYLKYKKEYLNSLGRGATFKEISKSIVENVIIPIPPKSTQLAIASELDKINELIRLKKEQLVEYNNLAQSIFYEMFGDPVENEKGWELKKFINVVTLQRGYDLPTQQRDPSGSIPVYGSNGVLGYHSESKLDSGIITGRSGTIGEVYISKTPCWPLNTTLFSKETHGNNLIYLCYFLRFFDLKRFVQGAGVPTLNRNNFHDKMIIAPPLEFQQTFASRIEQIEKLKSEVQNAITDLETLLASRMQYWFE